MRSARLLLLATAFPAFVAGVLILAMAELGATAWAVELVVLALTCAVALFVRIPRASRRPGLQHQAICLIALAGIAAPLLAGGTHPARWLSVGPFSIYMASLLLPALIAASAALWQQGGKAADLGLAALTLAGVLLALQPDASQVLAVLAATLIAGVLLRREGGRWWLGVMGLVLAALWAFRQPDPLQPVPYVEGVVEMALGHSLLAGAFVVAAASVLLLGMGWWARRYAGWMLAVAVYYAVLFGCSLAGLTPAPLIGFGAGPLLGFGLLVAVACSSVGDAAAATPVEARSGRASADGSAMLTG